MLFSLIELRQDIALCNTAFLYRSEVYGGHQLVWDLFSDGPDRRRDFLYRQEATGIRPKFYAVSRRPPVDHKGFWAISSKNYDPRIARGERLVFTLRVNPVKTKKDDKGRQHRHDVVMEARRQLGSSMKDHPMQEVIQEEGRRWLLERCEALGFDIATASLRIDGYRQHKFYKGKQVPPVSFSTLDINGILTVTDPEEFVEKCLFGGIGPAKGFGCGLMLVRRL